MASWEEVASNQPIKPRPLSPEERALMEFLLSAEFPGRDELRSQLDSVEAIGACECGCGTVSLQVAKSAAGVSAEKPIPVKAYGELVDVILLARNGFLSSLELVFHDPRAPRPFPKPGDLKLWVRPAPRPQIQEPPKGSG